MRALIAFCGISSVLLVTALGSHAAAQEGPACSPSVVVYFLSKSDRERTYEIYDDVAKKVTELTLAPGARVPISFCGRDYRGEGRLAFIDWRVKGEGDEFCSAGAGAICSSVGHHDGAEVVLEEGITYSTTKAVFDALKDRDALAGYITAVELGFGFSVPQGTSLADVVIRHQMATWQMQSLLAVQNQRIIELLEKLVDQDRPDQPRSERPVFTEEGGSNVPTESSTTAEDGLRE